MSNILNLAYLSQYNNGTRLPNINEIFYGPMPTYSPFIVPPSSLNTSPNMPQILPLSNNMMLNNTLSNNTMLNNTMLNNMMLNNTLSNNTLYNNTLSNNLDKPSKYFLVPGQDYQYNYYYQNINKDPSLRKQMTKFYIDELNEWVEYDSTLLKLKSIVTKENYKQNRKIVYKLLRRFVNHNNVNWFDLKNYYVILKKAIIKELYN